MYAQVEVPPSKQRTRQDERSSSPTSAPSSTSSSGSRTRIRYCSDDALSRLSSENPSLPRQQRVTPSHRATPFAHECVTSRDAHRRLGTRVYPSRASRLKTEGASFAMTRVHSCSRCLEAPFVAVAAVSVNSLTTSTRTSDTYEHSTSVVDMEKTKEKTQC